jgi:hypothetical protein
LDVNKQRSIIRAQVRFRSCPRSEAARVEPDIIRVWVRQITFLFFFLAERDFKVGVTHKGKMIP